MPGDSHVDYFEVIFGDDERDNGDAVLNQLAVDFRKIRATAGPSATETVLGRLKAANFRQLFQESRHLCRFLQHLNLQSQSRLQLFKDVVDPACSQQGTGF